MITKIPGFIQKLFPTRLWKVSTKENVLYLTFDDGPIPEVTPWVLKQLKKHNAKATFFCIGDNIRKHPEIFQQIISEEHSIGNHTFNHLNGWKTSSEAYLENCLLAEEAILKVSKSQREKRKENKEKREDNLINFKLFRPPYGRLTGKQAQLLQKKRFKIIMWDVLSRDYNRFLSAEKCFRNVITHSRPGSIIVFHDSLKASRNLKIVLPKVLKHFSSLGYCFEKL